MQDVSLSKPYGLPPLRLARARKGASIRKGRKRVIKRKRLRWERKPLPRRLVCKNVERIKTRSSSKNDGRRSQTLFKEQPQIASWLLHMFRAYKELCRAVLSQIKADVKALDASTLNGEIKDMSKHARCMAVMLPFASAGGVHALIIITKAVSSFINVYLLLLFVRVLLSWFPTFRWDKNPWIILRQVTDPYLNLFRGVVPPLLGTIDFTPLLGFFILQWLAGSLTTSGQEAYW